MSQSLRDFSSAVTKTEYAFQWMRCVMDNILFCEGMKLGETE